KIIKVTKSNLFTGIHHNLSKGRQTRSQRFYEIQIGRESVQIYNYFVATETELLFAEDEEKTFKKLINYLMNRLVGEERKAFEKIKKEETDVEIVQFILGTLGEKKLE